MGSNTSSAPDAARRAARYGYLVLLLTSVHHVYGGYVYGTPWRYHVIPVAAITALVMFGARSLMRARPAGPIGTGARWLFAIATLVVPVLTVGAFEGFYNHLVKNLLYFGGASPALMGRLFPPPTYELPDDVFFEVTGILQVVPAALAGWHLFRMPQRTERRTGASMASEQPHRRDNRRG